MSVRLFTLALALAIALPLAPASAGPGFKLLPKSSLRTQIPENASKDEIQAICDAMVDRQDASAIGRMDAATLYLHGKIHNVGCVKVDFYKALSLAKASGDAFTLRAALNYVRERANAGIPKAVSALETFEATQ